MPAIITKRGKRRYLAKVMVNGKLKAKLFPDVSIQSKRAAVQWELETKNRMQTELTATTSLSIINWMNEYMDNVRSRYSMKTYDEKQTVFRRFMEFTRYPLDKPVEQIAQEDVRNFLRHMADTVSGHASNKARKNLLAAWLWGERNVNGWPQMVNFFLKAERYKEEKNRRYVPPEADFWKVYELCDQQDKLMLLAFFHLGARRSELFSLKWSDVDFERRLVYLQTRKRDGGLEGDWVPLLPRLCDELRAWKKERETLTDMDREHVFVCLTNSPFCDDYYGLPFSQRRHFMKKLCMRAGVKHFGFHSIRHLFASTMWRRGVTLSHIQMLLRHKSPRITEQYLQSLGLERVRRSLERTFNNASGKSTIEVEPKAGGVRNGVQETGKGGPDGDAS